MPSSALSCAGWRRCRVSAGSALLLLALPACYPLSTVLPVAWGWENGVLEVLQVLVLLAGAGLALRAWRTQRPLPVAGLALCAAPVWLILAAREMSWGAVFLAPLASTDHGPVYASAVLWYKPLVPPVVGLVLGLGLLHVWRWRLDRLVWELARKGGLPWLPVGLAVLAEAGSSCAEGHLLCSFALRLPHAMVFEELVELLAYVALVMAQANMFGGGARAEAGKAAPEESRP